MADIDRKVSLCASIRELHGDHLLMHDHLICISFLDTLLVYLFLIMTKGEKTYVNCYCFSCFINICELLLLVVLLVWMNMDIGFMILYRWLEVMVWYLYGWKLWLILVFTLKCLVYNISGGFLTFQRKLYQNFQVFIMHMFRGSIKVKTESLLNLLIGCFVIIKKGEIVEPLLILMIPKHSHFVY